MTESTNGGSRIARNTMMLYMRMGVSMVVGLFTSRVILDTLGVDDFGIYGVVGSVVAMLDFLNGSMAGASSRFITYEIGRGDTDRLRKTFSTSLIVHCCIAILIFVLAETVGLWFLRNKLVIPDERMWAAMWVYQFSIVSAMFGITQVPYNATIIAHERMDVYAYVEMAHTLLKLVIVYLLYVGSFDRLVQYGAQVLIVSAGVALFYRWYAMKHFDEARFRFVFDKSIFREMGTYTVYGLFSSFALIFKNNGMVMIVNFFFGVAVNAAVSLAATVSGVVQGFASNVLTAIRPPLIMYYAQDNRQAFLRLFYSSITLMVALMTVSAMPFIMEMDYIFSLWLHEVPAWTVDMCRINLLGVPLVMAECVVNMSNQANGNIRLQAFSIGVFMLVQLPITFILLKLYSNPLLASAVPAVLSFGGLLITTYCTKRNIPYLNVGKLLSCALKSFIFCVCIAIPVYFVHMSMQQSFFRLLFTFVLYLTLALPLVYKVLFDEQMKALVHDIWNRKKNQALRR